MTIHSHLAQQEVKLPKGLVGPKCTASISVAGVACNCLLDTGSQVSTLSLSFYQKNLRNHTVWPLNNLLEVEGANGQSVPYLGYVEVDMTFPKAITGIETKILTLALVVPDLRSNSQLPILIGTNTLDVLYEQCCERRTIKNSSALYGYKEILKTLKLRRNQNSSGRLGWVKLRSKKQKVIPAGQKVLLEGFACVNSINTEKWALLEQPRLSSLPGGLFLSSCLLSLPTHPPYKLPVFFKNETDHDVILPASCIIADLNVPHRVINGTFDKGNQCNKTYGSLATSYSASASQKKTTEKTELTFDFGDSPLPEDWKTRISQKLGEMSDVFACHDMDFGHTSKVKHHIKLKDETPFKQRPRPIHPQDFEAVRKHLQELLDTDVIRESESPFASPIVVVRKKNGDVRLCIDYRKLNLQTIKDAYALPNLEETFSALTGSKWFSVMDLKSGYYQIELEECDKPKTAFVCPLGFWEFNRMPQGITNAPSTFQRLMEKCMGNMNLKEVLVFLDDLIVFSETLEEHENRLLRVLHRLKEYGLKLSPEKCKFFQTSVRYLGHIVTQNGVETDPEKVCALKTWPRPNNLKELRSFLGFSGYYRRFVKDYSKIVKPLNELTSGYPPIRKGSKRIKPGCKYFNPKEPFADRWTPACQQAFDSIIEKLTSSPVLGFADPRLPYILHTDASTSGLGAALYQEQEGQMRVIAFASRGLSRSEARYPAHKLEFLALKWAVTEKFHDYLYGAPFSVITDNNPLTYILTSAKLDATSYRWLAALSTFSFDIKYRSGKQNMDADGLSRRPHGTLEDDIDSREESDRIQQFTSHHLSPPENVKLFTQDAIRAVCDRHTLQRNGDTEEDKFKLILVESLALEPEAVPDCFDQEGVSDGQITLPRMSNVDLVKQQKEDPVIGRVIALIESGNTFPTNLKYESPDLQLILRQWNHLELKHGILHRRRLDGKEVSYQLVLPEKLRSRVLESLHDEMGHMGIERTLDLVRSRFYWPRMAAAVEQKVKTCGRCVRRKAHPEKAAPLVNIQTTRPLELVCMDFLSLEPDNRDTRNILVITDNFTKYAVAIPTRDQKAATVAKSLWDHFVVHYGFPERLHSDQGRDFESHTIRELCALAGIRKVRTTPYHPRGNPVERFNRTLLSMLGTLKEKEKAHWRDFVKPLVHAYNCTRNEVTGFSPYELMFGRQPRLPIDIAFGLQPRGIEPKSHSQYVKNLRSYLEESYHIATENALKSAKTNKKRFDKLVRESTLQVGDRILVRNVSLRGKQKIADRWGADIHVVVKQMGELPVYVVRPENKDGPLRTLHRDLLLPCGFLPALEEKETTSGKTPVRRPRTRQNPFQDGENEPLHVESEDEDEYPLYLHKNPSMRDTRIIQVHDFYDPDRPTAVPISREEQVHAEDSDDPLPCTSSGLNPYAESFHPNAAGEREDIGDLPEVNPTSAEEQEDDTGNLPDMNPTNDEEQEVTGNLLEDLTDVNPSDDEKREEFNGTRNIAIEIETENTEENNPPCLDVNDTSVRRSTRSHRVPDRLEYQELGNPLSSVIQCLFHGLSTAIVNSLNGSEHHTRIKSLIPDAYQVV